MLHIIGLILKIIGILLLAILCLLLLIILTVLLVPIRYRVNAEHGENLLSVEGRANWLLQLINARFSFLEGVFHVRVRILWFTLFDNLVPKKPKEPKVKKVNKRAVVKKKKRSKLDIATSKKGSKYTVDEKTDTTAIKTLRKDVQWKDILQPEEKVILKPQGKDILKPDGVWRESPVPNISEKGKKVLQENQENLLIQVDTKRDTIGEEETKSIFQKVTDKIKNIFEKMKSIIEKIRNFFNELKSKIVNWLDSATKVKHKFRLISDFIRDELNREGFQLTYASLKRLLKHILPTKLKSRIVFGTGDPCSTGQALGVLGVLYSFYGDNVQIVPDFENKRLEGKHYARGRIRLITILIIVIKLILDKRFKQLRKNFQTLKEVL